MGVMKSVGQAVHEGQTFEWDTDRMSHVLRCIGIAPWGYVRGRQVLESNGPVRAKKMKKLCKDFLFRFIST